MNKQEWINHIEGTGLVRPSMGGDKIAWINRQREHRAIGCPDCAARLKTYKSNQAARAKNAILRELCGTSARAARLDMGL